MTTKKLKQHFVNIFKTKEGKIVIGQFPNWPLWLALGLYLLRFAPTHELQQISHWGVSVSLIYWSYLEIFQGVNTWRRILGLVVGTNSLIGILRLLNQIA